MERRSVPPGIPPMIGRLHVSQGWGARLGSLHDGRQLTLLPSYLTELLPGLSRLEVMYYLINGVSGDVKLIAKRYQQAIFRAL
jgi:hypothetical protein